MKKLLKTALYVRCASKEKNKPSSIESQLKELRKTCKSSRIVKEYVDEAKSGIDLNRPGLRRLLKDAKKGFFGALYISDPDRISRNSAQLLRILNQLKKNGVKVTFLKDPDLLSMWFANFYRKNLSESIKRGLAAKLKSLKTQAPFGYKKCYSRIIPEKKIASLIKKAFELYATGNYSLQEIKEFFLKQGGVTVSRSGILKILSNPYYGGRLKLGKETFQGSHKPLVTKEVFDAVQNRLHRKIVED